MKKKTVSMFKPKRCQYNPTFNKTGAKTRCKSEAWWKYRHDFGVTIYRCKEHMDKNYLLTATHWF